MEKTIIVKIKFSIGTIVYIVTDDRQTKRIVTAIIVCPDDSLLYEVNCGTITSRHYDFELSEEIDTVMKANS